MSKKIIKLLVLALSAIMLMSLLASCCCCPSDDDDGGSGGNYFCSHVWDEATFNKPKTCRECGATEGSAIGVYDWLEDYIIYNGTYSSGDYDLYLYTTTGTKIYLSYDYADEDINLYIYSYSTSSSYATLVGMELDRSMSGSYSWVLVDTYEDCMLGTVNARSFTKSTKTLSYDSSTFASSVNSSAKELAATAIRTGLIAFNAYFEDEGLSASDLGFTNFK